MTSHSISTAVAAEHRATLLRQAEEHRRAQEARLATGTRVTATTSTTVLGRLRRAAAQ